MRLAREMATVKLLFETLFDANQREVLLVDMFIAGTKGIVLREQYLTQNSSRGKIHGKKEMRKAVLVKVEFSFKDCLLKVSKKIESQGIFI